MAVVLAIHPTYTRDDIRRRPSVGQQQGGTVTSVVVAGLGGAELVRSRGWRE